jgi:sortase B
MKHKLPVIFAVISFLIFIGLLTAGIFMRRDMGERGNRLFAKTQAVRKSSEVTALSQNAEDTVSHDTAAESDNATAEADKPGGVSEDTVSGADAREEATEAPEEEGQREVLPQYRSLLEKNPYLAGWLATSDAAIDDPVLYTPKSQNYFLHRDIEGKDTENGSLFIAVIWHDDYHNTLIYGHNMRDGSSFGSLKKFADASYGLSHSTIRFDTLYEEREYELLAAFYSQIDEDELETEDDRAEADKRIEEESRKEKPEGELSLADLNLFEEFSDEDIYRQEKDEDNGRFRYYYYTDLSDRDDFEYYVKNVKERALYETGVDAEWGDDLLTMSTCSYHTKNGRFIVVAKRIR